MNPTPVDAPFTFFDEYSSRMNFMHLRIGAMKNLLYLSLSLFIYIYRWNDKRYVFEVELIKIKMNQIEIHMRVCYLIFEL